MSVAHAKLAGRHAECGSRVLTGCPRGKDPRTCRVFIAIGVSFSGAVDSWRTFDWSREVLLVSSDDIYLCIQRIGNVQKGRLE